MRIVGGRLRGRSLAAPPAGSATIRPTSDRLREAIFNVLAHGYDDPVPGARVLDLFAGTGALGLEAISRGAAFALFADTSAAARALIGRNTEALGLADVTRVVRRDAAALGPSPEPPASLAFCDPPYGQGLAERALVSCGQGGWLRPGALVVVEEAAEARVALPAGYDELERRRYGATEVTLARFKP